MDIQRIIAESVAGKAARSNVEDEGVKRGKQLEQMGKDLERERKDLAKQASLLSRTALERLLLATLSGIHFVRRRSHLYRLRDALSRSF